MRAAIITQPRDGIGENTSLGIITIALAKELSRKMEVIIYGRKNKDLDNPDFKGWSIGYKFVSVFFDNWITRPIIKVLKHSGFNKSKKLPPSSWVIYQLFYAIQIALSVRLRHCEIVHIHNYFQFVSIIRFFNRKIKIVLQMNCEWLTQLDRQTVERHISKADLVLSCSDFITNKNIECFPGLKDRFYTLYNGVNVMDFKKETVNAAPEKIGRILFVGRVSPEKGVHTLVEAFNQVAEQFPETELDIIGPVSTSDYILGFDQDDIVLKLAEFYNGRDYFAYVKSLIAPELTGRVRFHGAMPHSALVSFYSNSDIVVFPSVWNEPFGIPVAEAMASEVPIITTISGGIPEIVENENCGLLVKRNDPMHLAEAIKDLLGNKDKCLTMGKAGRERVSKIFSWEVIASNLFNYYKSIYPENSSLKAANQTYIREEYMGNNLEN